jgi:hypothetical protein
MTSVLALSTSQCPQSLNYRGLQLLNDNCNFTKVDCLSKYDIPVVNVNGMNNKIPKNIFIKRPKSYITFLKHMHGDNNPYILASGPGKGS